MVRVGECQDVYGLFPCTNTRDAEVVNVGGRDWGAVELVK